MEYSSLSRSEILELIKQQKAVILQTKIDMEPADNPQAQLIISELKTDLHELLTALQTTAHDRSHTLQQHTTNYELLLRQQSLRDATKSIRTFEPGSDVNRFITDLNKAYTIHVKPELREYPAVEKVGLVEIFCAELVGYYQFWCVCSIPDHQYRCTRFQVELVHVLVI